MTKICPCQLQIQFRRVFRMANLLYVHDYS